MNEPSYKEFENLLFASLIYNLQINEKDLNSLPKADSEIVDKYKFYYAREKAKEDFFKEKVRQVLAKTFKETLKEIKKERFD